MNRDVNALEWRDGKVRFIDQTALPNDEVYVETDDPQVIADAIRRLSIRGAPLIGIAAAYAVALAARRVPESDAQKVQFVLDKTINMLASTRPTAVNLFWALDRQRSVLQRHSHDPLSVLVSELTEEARGIHAEDRAMCERIGKLGADLLPNAATVLTHCNTGSLATGGIGTAQSVVSTAWAQHKLKHVYVDETRPLLQGARLTAWELQKLGIPATLITDSTAAFLMQRGLITAVVVGADRITLNGDVANKVGTYSLAVLAKHHGIPMYVAAPSSSIDFSITSGKDIMIEQRAGSEVAELKGVRIAPEAIDVYAPAFDITPGDLIAGIITEEGVVEPPYRPTIESMKKNRSRVSPRTAS